MIQLIYFIVILLACILGAIVGLGGGVFIRPIFDALGFHDVLNIAFFSSSAIFTMAIVSTAKKLRDGVKINAKVVLAISLGAVVGGVLGNLLLEYLVANMSSETYVQRVQIVATVIVLGLSIFFTTRNTLRVEVKARAFPLVLGVALGAVATFLGIGGGPINVPILMIFFGLGMKDATAYSIVIIFFSHLSRLVTMGMTVGYGHFDLVILTFVIPAAIIGGLTGANFSRIFSENTVKRLFIAAISGVIVLNIFNGLFLV